MGNVARLKGKGSHGKNGETGKAWSLRTLDKLSILKNVAAASSQPSVANGKIFAPFSIKGKKRVQSNSPTLFLIEMFLLTALAPSGKTAKSSSFSKSRLTFAEDQGTKPSSTNSA